MDKAITFENWQELRSYLDDYVSEVYEAADKRGMVYEEMFDYLVSLLHTKPKEDFGDDTTKSA